MKQIHKRKPKQKPKQIGDKGERGKRGLRKAEQTSPPELRTAPAAPSISAVNTGELQGAAQDPGTLRFAAKQGETSAQTDGRLGMSPIIQHTAIARTFIQPSLAGVTLDLTACVNQITADLAAIAKGDMSPAEQMHFAQATSCNAIYLDLVRRGGLNLGVNLDVAERYFRLAFKAQAQSRASLEALAEMKNPRPVFINAKQANLSNGPQQVNNGVVSTSLRPVEPEAACEQTPLSSNKLLENS